MNNFHKNFLLFFLSCNITNAQMPYGINYSTDNTSSNLEFFGHKQTSPESKMLLSIIILLFNNDKEPIENTLMLFHGQNIENFAQKQKINKIKSASEQMLLETAENNTEHNVKIPTQQQEANETKSTSEQMLLETAAGRKEAAEENKTEISILLPKALEISQLPGVQLSGTGLLAITRQFNEKIKILKDETLKSKLRKIKLENLHSSSAKLLIKYTEDEKIQILNILLQILETVPLIDLTIFDKLISALYGHDIEYLTDPINNSIYKIDLLKNVNLLYYTVQLINLRLAHYNMRAFKFMEKNIIYKNNPTDQSVVIDQEAFEEEFSNIQSDTTNNYDLLVISSIENIQYNKEEAKILNKYFQNAKNSTLNQNLTKLRNLLFEFITHEKQWKNIDSTYLSNLHALDNIYVELSTKTGYEKNTEYVFFIIKDQATKPLQMQYIIQIINKILYRNKLIIIKLLNKDIEYKFGKSEFEFEIIYDGNFTNNMQIALNGHNFFTINFTNNATIAITSLSYLNSSMHIKHDSKLQVM